MNEITIYSKNGCTNCMRAISMCKAAGIEPTVLKLENGDFTVDDFVEKFQSRSLPGITINGDVTVFSNLAESLK